MESGGGGGVAPGPGEGRGFSLLPVHTAQLSQQDLELIGTRLEIQVRAAGEGDPCQDDFRATFGGMEEALGEVQSRGQRMMGTVRRQRDLLARMEEEMEVARGRREEVARLLEEEERRRAEVREEREEEERETARIGRLMLRIAERLDRMEDRKARWVAIIDKCPVPWISGSWHGRWLRGRRW